MFIISIYLNKETDLESEEKQIIEYGLCLYVSLILYDVTGCQKHFIEDQD